MFAIGIIVTDCMSFLCRRLVWITLMRWSGTRSSWWISLESGSMFRFFNEWRVSRRRWCCWCQSVLILLFLMMICHDKEDEGQRP